MNLPTVEKLIGVDLSDIVICTVYLVHVCIVSPLSILLLGILLKYSQEAVDNSNVGAGTWRRLVQY